MLYKLVNTSCRQKPLNQYWLPPGKRIILGTHLTMHFIFKGEGLDCLPVAVFEGRIKLRLLMRTGALHIPANSLMVIRGIQFEDDHTPARLRVETFKLKKPCSLNGGVYE